MNQNNLAKNLLNARNSLGYSQTQAGDAIGISASSISEWEQGRREPSIAQLQGLADFYKRPLDSFFKEPSELTPVLWRDKPKGFDAPRIEAEFLQLIRQYRNLETWTKANPTGRFDDLFATDIPSSFEQSEALAYQVWKKIGLGDRPGESLLRILEETYGLKVFHLDLGKLGCAASWYDLDCGPAVLLNRNSSRWRRNFDLAHELFHLVCWQKAPKQECVENSAVEKLAQVFAGALLMPVEPLKVCLVGEMKGKGAISIESLEYIARQFDVSLVALFWRIVNIYRIPKAKAMDLHKVLVTEAAALEKRAEEPSPRVYPARYEFLAQEALRIGEISRARFKEYLKHEEIEDSEIDRIAEHPSGQADLTLVTA